jgi:P27 family predicted phage terminase small subunit
MGRPRKPTAIKILEGNPGGRPLPKNEPRPTLALPEAPAHMSKDGRSEWNRLADQLAKLGLATGLDVAALSCYCEQYSIWLQARRAIARKGLTYTVRGVIRKRPEVLIAEQAARIMRQYLLEFGLTPRSRATVAAAMAEGRQPLLPMDLPEAPDPNKPALPTTPLDAMSDEEFLGGSRPQ